MMPTPVKIVLYLQIFAAAVSAYLAFYARFSIVTSGFILALPILIVIGIFQRSEFIRKLILIFSLFGIASIVPRAVTLYFSEGIPVSIHSIFAVVIDAFTAACVSLPSAKAYFKNDNTAEQDAAANP